MVERFYGYAYTIIDNRLILRKPYYYTYPDKKLFTPVEFPFLTNLILYKKVNVFSICKNSNCITKIDLNCWSDFLPELYNVLETNLDYNFCFNKKITNFFESKNLNYSNNTIGMKYDGSKVTSLCLYYRLTDSHSISNEEFLELLHEIFETRNNNIYFEKSSMVSIIALDFDFISKKWKIKIYLRVKNNLNTNIFYNKTIESINDMILSSPAITNNKLALDYVQYAFNAFGLVSSNLCYSTFDKPDY